MPLHNLEDCHYAEVYRADASAVRKRQVYAASRNRRLDSPRTGMVRLFFAVHYKIDDQGPPAV